MVLYNLFVSIEEMSRSLFAFAWCERTINETIKLYQGAMQFKFFPKFNLSRHVCQIWMADMPKGPFTQSISVSGNANAKMGTEPIHFAASALPLTLMLCMNRIIYNANTPSKT